MPSRFVLPVARFLDNDVHPYLPDDDHRRLLRFQEDIDAHLAASRASVRLAATVAVETGASTEVPPTDH